jgi:hypothetical protein
MDYNRLISVTGLTGLFELQSSKQDGAIVKSLIDGKSTFISSRKHQFSHLDGIEVYTTNDNVNLVEVFKAMQASTEALPNPKNDADVKNYFKKVYPNMDFDRVYLSDNRKMVKWYQSIVDNKIELPTNEATEAPATEEEPVKEAAEAPKPKKAAKPKAAATAADTATEATAEPKPKKAATKKKKDAE